MIANRFQTALRITTLLALCVAPLPLIATGRRSQLSHSAAPDQTPLTSEQVRDLISRTIANQHRDDAALDSFERVEHDETHLGSSSKPAAEDRIYRVVPTGSGTLRILMRQNGTPVPNALYRRQLRDWEAVLEVAVHNDDPRETAVVAKQQKKRKERARFVDAVPNAYRITWLGREIRDGRTVEKLQMEPNPAYPPHGDTTDWLSHVRATVWIDPQAAQVVSVDATIIRDISFVGGVLGKVYRGGRFYMQQAPAATDIWLPTLYQYDISGRKFLFSFALRDVTTASHYVFLGAADKALIEARNDLAHCCNMTPDP